VFSRRYIKSLELLHDCDDLDGSEHVDQHSNTCCAARKSSQITINNSEINENVDEKKFF